MKKKMTEYFSITAYYSENICIFNDKYNNLTNGVLTDFLNYDARKLEVYYEDLKSLLQKLLFKLDGAYDVWNDYNKNVEKTQNLLNKIKRLLNTLPVYKYTVDTNALDYHDLRHLLNYHDYLFDSSFDNRMSNKEDKLTKKKRDVSGFYGEYCGDDEDGESLFYNNYDPRRVAPERRYDDGDYEFLTSHVLEDHTVCDDHLYYFQPKWIDDGKITIEDANAAEMLNNDLRILIEPYLNMLKTVITAKRWYGTFLDKYVHTKGRFLSSDEIAIVFEKFLKEKTYSGSMKPNGNMSLESKVINHNGKPLWCDTYIFDSLDAFLYFDFFRGLRAGFIPKKCEHCGEYFLLTSGRYYEFCDRTLKDNPKKTCRDIGSHKKYEEKCKNDPIWLAYNRAYKAHYARQMKKKMTKSEFLIWSDWAVEYRDKAIAGEVELEEYEINIKK